MYVIKHFVPFWAKGVGNSFKSAWNEWNASLKATRTNWRILRLIAKPRVVSIEEMARHMADHPVDPYKIADDLRARGLLRH